MTHVHTSLLHSVDAAAVAAHVRRTITRLQPRSMSTTESDGFRAELRGIPGYVTIHPTGGDGQTESALIVADDALAAALPAVQLSRLPVPRRGGEHVYAAAADLVTGSRILGLHMPSGVESPDGFSDDHPGQVAAYRDAIGGLRRYVAEHPQVTEIYGDWNLRADLEWVRVYFAKHFPDFAIVAPREATHAGGRTIDWALIRKGHGRYAAVAEPNPVSDHEAVITRKETAVMANRYPAADWEPLGPQTEDRMTSHDIICIHTMVGSLLGTDSMFKANGYGGTESHFGTGGNGERVLQWQDLAFSADANLNGWRRVISIENADKGPGFPTWSGSDVPAFTDVQVDQLVDLVAWLCSKEAHSACPATWKCHQVGIPAELIPDTLPGRRGIGYHRQGIDGNLPDMRVPGGEEWSENFGKICPADRRIAQIKGALIPRVQARFNPREDVDMTPETADSIRTIVREEIAAAKINLGDGRVVNDDTIARGILARLDRIEASLKAKG